MTRARTCSAGRESAFFRPVFGASATADTAVAHISLKHTTALSSLTEEWVLLCRFDFSEILNYEAWGSTTSKGLASGKDTAPIFIPSPGSHPVVPVRTHRARYGTRSRAAPMRPRPFEDLPTDKRRGSFGFRTPRPLANSRASVEPPRRPRRPLYKAALIAPQVSPHAPATEPEPMMGHIPWRA
jgi:hypothetical protein